MTAIPGTAIDTVDLICDECATVLPAKASTSLDEDVVWPIIAAVGWNGSPFAAGPHRCPSCDSTTRMPPARQRPGDQRRTGLEWRVAAAPAARAVVLTVRGDLCSPAVDDLHPTLAALSASGRHVVLDLAGVDVMDPAGLGSLVRAHQAARKCDAVLCLVAPSRFIRTALHTMRLEDLFPLFDTDHAALGWLMAQFAGTYRDR